MDKPCSYCICNCDKACVSEIQEKAYQQGREDAFKEIAYSDSVIKEPFETLAYEKGKTDGISQCLEIVQKIKDEHIDSNFIYPINYGTLCRIIIKLERLING